MMYGREGSQRTYGEIGILALQYTDIDWTNKEIVINKAISKTKMSDGVRKWEWQIGPPKSRKSNRRVAAADAVLELLRGLRSKAEDFSGLIFRGPEGKRMDPDYFDAFIFGRIAAHAGLSGVRFHDLRHFFASMLIAQGESAKYVCDQDGRVLSRYQAAVPSEAENLLQRGKR